MKHTQLARSEFKLPEERVGPGPLQLVLQVILFVPVRLVYETSGIVDDLLAVLLRCVYLCPLAGRNGFSSRF